MQKQTLTPDQFSEKLQRELVNAGKSAPKDTLTLDKENEESDPIGWMMRNIMRIELARIMFLRVIYSRFKDNGDKRFTADLIISSSRTFAAALMKESLLKVAGNPEDLEKFAFITGIDPTVLAKDLLSAHLDISGAASNLAGEPPTVDASIPLPDAVGELVPEPAPPAA